MITVDTREPWEQIADNLVEMGADFRVDTLGHKCDFLIDGHGEGTYGVQRKTVNDFVGSIDTLKNDLDELRTHHDLSALLLEGEWSVAVEALAIRRGRKLSPVMNLKQFHNFILSQQVRGTMFIRTTSLSETCRVVAYADEWFESGMTPPRDSVADSSDLLLLLPGIGPTSKSRVIEEFGDTKTALENVDEWTEVSGIGPKTRDQVVEFLTHEE